MRKDIRTNMMDFNNFLRKNYIRIAFAMPIVTMLGLGALSSGGCDNGTSPFSGGRSFTQIDKLARPAIAEGLILSDTGFASWHAARPDQETGTLAVAEMVKTLKSIHYALGLGSVAADAASALRVDTIVKAFFPDVMRINTAVNSGLTASATIGGTGVLANESGIVRPTGGRKLTDDAIDVVLNLLTDTVGTGVGASLATGFNGDSVPYRPTIPSAGVWLGFNVGDTNPAIGHRALMGQGSNPVGSAKFPFLAEAN